MLIFASTHCGPAVYSFGTQQQPPRSILTPFSASWFWALSPKWPNEVFTLSAIFLIVMGPFIWSISYKVNSGICWFWRNWCIACKLCKLGHRIVSSILLPFGYVQSLIWCSCLASLSLSACQEACQVYLLFKINHFASLIFLWLMESLLFSVSLISDPIFIIYSLLALDVFCFSFSTFLRRELAGLIWGFLFSNGWV